MQVATVAVIAEHKIAAAISGENPRTSRFMDDPQAVVERYKPAFAEDLLLSDRDPNEIVLTLQANVEENC